MAVGRAHERAESGADAHACPSGSFDAGSTVARVSPGDTESRARLERAARQDFQFIWRCIRRFGIHSDQAVDDAVQRVFEVAVSRASLIEPGRERAFLFKTAVFVTKELRRKQARSRVVFDNQRVEREWDDQGDPEQILEARRWRTILDELLEALPLDLRTVFVLYELEGQSLVQIAEILGIPQGTVSSRLRRAREAFYAKSQQVKAIYSKYQVKP